MQIPADSPENGDPLSALREELRQLLETQEDAWNRGDLEGFMAAFWHSSDFCLSSGRDCFRGWQSTLERYRRIYQNDSRQMGRLELSDLEITSLGSDSAFIRGRWQMASAQEVLSGLFTLICRKLPEGWRIVHDHTSG